MCPVVRVVVTGHVTVYPRMHLPEDWRSTGQTDQGCGVGRGAGDSDQCPVGPAMDTHLTGHSTRQTVVLTVLSSHIEKSVIINNLGNPHIS